MWKCKKTFKHTQPCEGCETAKRLNKLKVSPAFVKPKRLELVEWIEE